MTPTPSAQPSVDLAGAINAAAEELDEYARRFGSDKGTHRVGEYMLGPKGYTQHYARFFAPMRNRPLRVLEIGVRSGASIKMWEAFFPKAQIYGLDILESCREFAGDRTKIFIGDQADRRFLRSMVEEIGAPIDIVIDDGGHTMRQHRVSLEELLPHVASGGLYVIEDLGTAYESRFGGGYLHPRSTIELLKKALDCVNGGPEPFGRQRWDRRLRSSIHAVLTARRPQRRLWELLERVESYHFCRWLAFLNVR